MSRCKKKQIGSRIPTSNMKYHATCPSCGVRFPRWHFFKCAPHIPYRCRSCGCNYQSESVWEWVGDAIGASVLGGILSLAIFRVVPWLDAALCSVAFLALGHLLFPYFTRFVRV